MKITPLTPTEAYLQLVKTRDLLKRIRDERIMHPSISIETREFIGNYFGDKLEALDIGIAAVMQVHKIKAVPNVVEDALIHAKAL